jgi:hypothetical protein
MGLIADFATREGALQYGVLLRSDGAQPIRGPGFIVSAYLFDALGPASAAMSHISGPEMLRQLQPFRLVVAADVLGVNLIRSLDPGRGVVC